jgi:circadian clock protein KaiC
MRNMRAIGIDLEPWLAQGLLRFQAHRPTFMGLEMHLTTMHKAVSVFDPQVVVVDPLNSFLIGDNAIEVKSMLMRLVDFLKMQQITGLFTSLTAGGSVLEQTDVNISSLIDTWLLLRDIESGGERNRGLYILKARGIAHSNQIREFLITDHGVELRDVYVGPAGVLTGSARLAQEAQEQAEQIARHQEVARRRLELERQRTTMEAQIAILRAGFVVQEAETLALIEQEKAQEAQLVQTRVELAMSRQADPEIVPPVEMERG